MLAWKRGADEHPVVVVANFSDFESGPEYRINGWPAGRHWRDASQGRDVPDEWAGREPLFRWEAKVYVAGRLTGPGPAG